MNTTGTGVPLVTPFDADGTVNESALRDLVGIVERAGVDFVVPCGSNGEAALMTREERTTVTSIVAEETTIPVLAGTGHPSERATVEQTTAAAEVGADAALVVTPYYHAHEQGALASYYRRVADESPIPIYLYNVPKYASVELAARTVESLASHANVAGIKDSSGNLETLQRYVALTETESFDVLVGSGSIYAAGLDAGASGGVLALANVVPDLASTIYRRHDTGERARARSLNRDLVELNHAITGVYGVPGVKAAMRERDYPAGRARSPFTPVNDAGRTELATLLEDALERHVTTSDGE